MAAVKGLSAQEMDVMFDVLYNNITSNQAPGLNSYEKSVLLTKAQDETLKNHFNAKANTLRDGFDDAIKRQVDFSSITVVESVDSFSAPIFDKRSKGVKSAYMPEDVMFILNESLKVIRKGNEIYLNVIPISYAEYSVLMSKPYKRPLKNQAWRMLLKSDVNSCDLIAGENDTLEEYTIKYIRRPMPIIIGNDFGLTLNGESMSADKDCELDPILHEEILQRAVELAKVAWQGDLNSSLAAGNRSE